MIKAIAFSPDGALAGLTEDNRVLWWSEGNQLWIMRK